MFALLMGLKTISPGELHRLLQNPEHISRNQWLARCEAADGIW